MVFILIVYTFVVVVNNLISKKFKSCQKIKKIKLSKKNEN